MRKPDDIPKDIWSAAVEVTKAAPTLFGWHKTTEALARAIMAEREVCALVANEAITNGTDLPTLDAAIIGSLVSMAIRDRGGVK